MKRLALVVMGCAWARGLAVVLLLAGSLPASFAQSSFTGLGAHNAAAVSDDGSVVVGQTMVGLEGRAFRWTAKDGMVVFGCLPGGHCSWATGVSSDGSVVFGESTTAFGDQPFRWTATGGMVRLDAIIGDSTNSLPKNLGAHGMSLRRGSANAASPLRPPIAKLHRSFPSNDPRIVATCVSSNGSVVAGFRLSSGLRGKAFRWTAAGGFVNLGSLPGCESSSADGMSRDGSVIVGSGSSGPSEGPSIERAFIWDNVHGMRDLQSVLIDHYHLDLNGWQLRRATRISADDKTIIGSGKHNDGFEAWVAHLDRPLNETGKAKGK